MKPFITPEISVAGQKVLHFQCENIERNNISSLLKNLSVVGYSMPPGHSFQGAWVFRLIFNNDSLLEFSSACTMLDGWEEVGSLNIQLMDGTTIQESEKNAVLDKVEIPPFRVVSLAKFIYEEGDFRSECGIAICGEDEKEIVIATGVSPGSVSIAAPFSVAPFEPEFPLSQCKRELL